MLLQIFVFSVFKMRTQKIVHQISARASQNGAEVNSYLPIFLLNLFLTSVEKRSILAEIRGHFKLVLRTIRICTQRAEIVMGDLSLCSILATVAENLNIELRKGRLRIAHKIYLMNNWYLPEKKGCI